MATWSPFTPGSAGNYLGEVASQVARLALVATRGDWCVQTDIGKACFLTGNDSTNNAAWTIMPTGKVFDAISVESGSDYTGNADIIQPDRSIQYVNPSAASEGIFFAMFGQSVYGSTFPLINGGHFLGVMGWSVLNANATVAMGIGVEGRYEHNPGATATGVTTQAKAILGLLSNRAGTMANAKGLAADLQNYSGATMTNAYGCFVEVTVNQGTIGKFVGFGMPNLTDTIPNVGTKRFFENLDPQAPSTSLAPIIEQCYGYTQMTSGGSYTIPKNISDFQLIKSDGTAVAAYTVKLPALATIVDGQELCIATNAAITALTLDGQGVTIFNPPTSLAAGGCVRLKFYGNGVNSWFRR